MDLIDVIKLSSPETLGFWEIPVLYADEYLLALDKPVDLPVEPEEQPSDGGASEARPDLLSLLHRGIEQRKPWAQALDLSFLSNVHRLDPEAGGVQLFARTKPALTALNDLFGSEKPTLQYLAIAQGNPEADQFDLDDPLLPKPDPAGRYRVSHRDGKRSRTLFRVVERFRSHAVLACEPLTHRRHQVRAHLARLGLPLAGDALYGGDPLLLSRIKPGYRLKPKHTERPLLGRPALHAQTLAIAHPVTGQALTLTAPLPRDFEVALKYLRKYGLR